MGNSCPSLGCYLAQKGGLVSFPLVTIAGLVDGINPCAIGIIILLLGYLIIFANKPERILKTGGVYIATVYLTYLLIGLFFYQSAYLLNTSIWRSIFNKVLALGLFLAGTINIKDYFRPEIGPHLEIPQRVRPHLAKLVEKVSLPAACLLGFLVTILEAPCSLPIYLGTATILSQTALPYIAVLGYFLYYNFLFVLPLIIILFLVWKGREMIVLKEWEHKYKKWMKLSIGTLLLLMGIWIFIW